MPKSKQACHVLHALQNIYYTGLTKGKEGPLGYRLSVRSPSKEVPLYILNVIKGRSCRQLIFLFQSRGMCNDFSDVSVVVEGLLVVVKIWYFTISISLFS